MNRGRQKRYLRILELYRGDLDRARASLVEAVEGERRAVRAHEDAIAQHAAACASSARRLSEGATAPEFVQAGQWCAVLMQRCEAAEAASTESVRRVHLARQRVQRVYRNVETMEALLRGIAKEDAIERARQIRREEDALVKVRTRETAGG